MGRWRDHFRRLSRQESARRESAFEASALASLGAGTATGEPGRAVAAGAAPVAGAPITAVALTVTEAGATTVYRRPEEVPEHVRRHLIELWRALDRRPDSSRGATAPSPTPPRRGDPLP